MSQSPSESSEKIKIKGYGCDRKMKYLNEMKKQFYRNNLIKPDLISIKE